MRFPLSNSYFVITLVLGTAVHAEELPTQSELPPKSSPARAWMTFRGSSLQTGVAESILPDRPEMLWTFECKEPISSTAAIVEGSVYFGCEDGALYALNLTDGSLRWKYESGGDVIQAPPTVDSGMVFIGDLAGTMHGVNATDGKKRWTFATGGQIISGANVAGESVVFGSYDGFVYCLRVADGTLQWKFETAGRVHGTPAITENTVIAAGCDEYLHVLKLADGQSIRKITLGSVSGSSAAVHGSQVFVGTYGNRVLGMDWQKGTVSWSFEDADRQFPFLSSAAVGHGLVLIGGRDRQLHALDQQTGKQSWAFSTRGRIDGSPLIVGNRAFFGSGDGVIYALDVKSGREDWRFETGSGISASPSVADEKMVIGTQDGVLYCFGKK